MIKTLRKRFIRIAVLAVTAVLLMLCLIVNIANYASVDRDLIRMLQMISGNQGTVPQMPQGVKPDGKQGGGFTPETPFSTRYFVLRYDDEGVLVNADLGSIAAVTTDDTTAYLQVATKHGVGYGWSNGYRYYVVKNGENRNMAIFLDAHRDLQTVKTTAWLSLAAMLFCVACVYLVVTLLSRRAIDPVVKASEKQKQFITDAGHELKTPITVIATSLKVLEMESGENKWIDKSLAQTEKLRDLVNSLVSLSRMDEEQSPLKMCDFSLSDAVSEIVGSFADFAAANGHMLTAEIAPEILYHGDEYAIRQMVSILLDNAVKYASDGSPIRLTLEKGKKGPVLRTVNCCEGLTQQQADKLFDRFYRVDQSRTTGGFGIGLSMARSIAEGHKGSIKATCREENKIEFTVLLGKCV
jgi:two-component system sensor histidine kinase CiaH